MAGNNSNYPYWTSGWTAQHPVYGHDWQDDLGNIAYPDPAVLPDDVTSVTVHASYLDLRGRHFDAMVTFTVVGQSRDADGVTVLLPTEFKTWVKNGVLEIDLPAGFTYSVVEGMPGGKKYQIAIPVDADADVDLISLVVADQNNS